MDQVHGSDLLRLGGTAQVSIGLKRESGTPSGIRTHIYGLQDRGSRSCFRHLVGIIQVRAASIFRRTLASETNSNMLAMSWALSPKSTFDTVFSPVSWHMPAYH